MRLGCGLKITADGPAPATPARPAPSLQETFHGCSKARIGTDKYFAIFALGCLFTPGPSPVVPKEHTYIRAIQAGVWAFISRHQACSFFFFDQARAQGPLRRAQTEFFRGYCQGPSTVPKGSGTLRHYCFPDDMLQPAHWGRDRNDKKDGCQLTKKGLCRYSRPEKRLMINIDSNQVKFARVLLSTWFVRINRS